MTGESLKIMADEKEAPKEEKTDAGKTADPGDEGGDTQPVGHGGARAGAGRPPGVKNKPKPDTDPGTASEAASGEGSDVRGKGTSPTDEKGPPAKEKEPMAPDEGSEETRTARTSKRVAPKTGSGSGDAGTSGTAEPKRDIVTPLLILCGGALALGLIYLSRTRASTDGAAADEGPADAAVALAGEAWEAARQEIASISDKLEMRLSRR